MQCSNNLLIARLCVCLWVAWCPCSWFVFFFLFILAPTTITMMSSIPIRTQPPPKAPARIHTIESSAGELLGEGLLVFRGTSVETSAAVLVSVHVVKHAILEVQKF